MAEIKGRSYYGSSSGSSNFDVFLNFRGEDTRNNFTGFLHKALKNSGINVFIDNEKLRTGEAIGPALLHAIEESKISIPVFSKSYASSKWCLLELSHILYCHQSKGQMVLPIFFDIEPSHVRNQIGCFEEPFRKHEKNFKPQMVKSWREALREIGNLKGWVLKEDVNGYQPALVELVVKRVLQELGSRTHLLVCKYPVAIESHVENVLSLLNIGSNDVQFIGICGFGGIGKTTIAKAIYNHILSEFNKGCFFPDVREQATRKDLACLQEQLVQGILKTDCFYIDYHHMRKKTIEERLCKENVLLILDDVDTQEQVDALAGELSWFGPGSRVIITTRDEHILNVAKVDKDRIYWPQELGQMESLRLFSLHAFSKPQPPEDYIQFSHDVACYSGGLPLTLEVLGSSLSGTSNKKVWESTLQKLKEIPHEKIHKRLKISYDNLEDDYQKAIFLDAACFFIGWEKETVISIWEACDYYPDATLHILIQRSLLTFECGFDEDGEFSKYYLKMHQQIRDMGRKIVKEESRMESGKCSRLWSHGEISEVLGGHTGTEKVKGMILPSDLPGVCLDSKHFEMMPNVRFLDISSAKFRGNFSCLPYELRWLRWKNCPWVILPTNFYCVKLVNLDLSGSKIGQAWNIRPQDKNKRFQKLKVLNLRDCDYLSKSPHFSWFPSLERLDLTNCRSLDKLDESIGQLSQLKSLNLKGCSQIKELPGSIICNLKSLQELILAWCTSLRGLPNGIGLLEKLEVLDAEGCLRLVKLPRSMVRMRCLHSLNLRSTRISKFPNDFSKIPNLIELNVNAFAMQAHNINSNWTFCDWTELKYLPELPSSLVEFHCQGRVSLVRLPDLSRLKFLRTLCIRGCDKLEEIRGLEATKSLEELNARQCYNLTRSSKKIHGQGTLTPNRPQQNRYPLTTNDGICKKGLILCLVFKFPSQMDQLQTIDLDISASIYQNDKSIRCYHSLRIEDIEDIEDTAERDIIYVHHFKGFDWFGIPLQGKDAIEILDIQTYGAVVKFWKVLFNEGELSSAMIVADFFNWSYVNDNDNGGVSFLKPSLEGWSQGEGEGSNSVLEKGNPDENGRSIY